MTPIPGFTQEAVVSWARSNLRPGTNVLGDGLNCFVGVIDAGCVHSYIVVGDRMPREQPLFRWVNTILGNLKITISGGYKAVNFRKYANRHLGAFSNRFNRRLNLHGPVTQLFADASGLQHEHERKIRGVAELHA